MSPTRDLMAEAKIAYLLIMIDQIGHELGTEAGAPPGVVLAAAQSLREAVRRQKGYPDTPHAEGVGLRERGW